MSSLASFEVDRSHFLERHERWLAEKSSEADHARRGLRAGELAARIFEQLPSVAAPDSDGEGADSMPKRRLHIDVDANQGTGVPQ